MWKNLLTALFVIGAFAGAARAQTNLDGTACVGTMVSDNGGKGAAAFVFERRDGILTVHHYFGLGVRYHDRMAQAIAASATPAYDWLIDGGYNANLRVSGPEITFERRGIDPRNGAPVLFRTYRMNYGSGRMTGQSTPVNDVMENGGPGRPSNFNMTCFAGMRQARD